ncbi:MAG: cyclic nucleotide-binding domain-containing protein [Magnetospirillum sp.]|nr:cyclic nucleotide-binding domain-containing protein [Magnetospirillum sp.]
MTCPCRQICLVPKPGCTRPHGSLPRHRTAGPQLAAQVMGLPLFSGLDHDVLEKLMADASALTCARRSMLFSGGSQADCFYIVLDGQVKLFALTSDGRESIVEVFTPVSSFGEAAMLSTGSFPLHAEVIEDATLIRVGRRAFVNTLRDDHAVAYRMLVNMCRRHQRLSGEIHHLKHSQPWQRVAEFLLALTEAAEGTALVALPFNKEVLASRLGIRRESLSRVLARLKEVGVRTEGNAVRIDDVGSLRRRCAEAAH